MKYLLFRIFIYISLLILAIIGPPLMILFGFIVGNFAISSEGHIGCYRMRYETRWKLRGCPYCLLIIPLAVLNMAIFLIPTVLFACIFLPLYYLFLALFLPYIAFRWCLKKNRHIRTTGREDHFSNILKERQEQEKKD